MVLDKEIIFSPACGNWQGGVVGILWQACLHPGSALWSLRFFHHIAPYPFVPVQLGLSFLGGHKQIGKFIRVVQEVVSPILNFRIY